MFEFKITSQFVQVIYLCRLSRLALDSYETKTLSTDDYSSSLFGKGISPPYRETIDIDDS
jgi:hypothetical protein